jgi:hypothetical protein
MLKRTVKIDQELVEKRDFLHRQLDNSHWWQLDTASFHLQS